MKTVRLALTLCFRDIPLQRWRHILRPVEGREFVARAKHTADHRVILETPMGEYSFPASDFRAIVRAPDQGETVEEKKQKAMASSAEECCSAALWALDAGARRGMRSHDPRSESQGSKHQPSARMFQSLDRLNREWRPTRI